MSEGTRKQGLWKRRALLKASLSVLAAPTIFSRRASAQTEKTLKVVHWKHFVPSYDIYFKGFARRFGERHNCKVEVDFVATPEVPTAIAADISRGGGHDIFHLYGTGAWLHDQVEVDVTDVANRLAKQFGGWSQGSEDIAVVKGKWLAIPHWYIRFPWIVNRAYLDQVKEDYDGKTTYEDIIRIGAKLKKIGHPIGIPYSPTPDANDALIPIMVAYKAYFFDKKGNIAFTRNEIAEVLRWGTALFKETMTDEVLSWDDASNNRFIASGKGSMICNPISAYRAAAKDNPDVYKALEIQPPPLGPAGRIGGARTMSLAIYKFSQVQDLAKEFLYEMNAEGLQGMENSAGYNHPFLKDFLKKPMPVIGHEPKLQIEQDFNDWVKFVGYPGPMTKTAIGMYARYIVPTMFAEVANVGKPPRAAMDEAERKLRAVAG